MEASWDAAVARMGSASPGGLLRRLTTPRASLPGDYAVLEAARAESALREVALSVGTPDGRGEGPDVEAAKKAASKAEKELKKKIKVRWGGGTRGGGGRGHPRRVCCLWRERSSGRGCTRDTQEFCDASEPRACTGGGGCTERADRPLLTHFFSCICGSPVLFVLLGVWHAPTCVFPICRIT